MSDLKLFAKRLKKFIAPIAAVLSVAILLMSDGFSFVSFADTGKITADPAAKLRKEASTTSDQLGSITKDTTVTVNSSTTGTDGKTWYQITYGGQTGYVRSDLIEVSAGGGNSSNSNSGSSTSSGTTTTTVAPPSLVMTGITEVNPTPGSVTGGNQINVRADASTKINPALATVSTGTSVNIIATKTGDDGQTWYLVSFTQNGKDNTGYIRNDFVNVTGEIIPVGQEEEPAEQTDTTPEPEPEPEPEKPANLKYDIQVEKNEAGEDVYSLLNYELGKKLDLEKMLGDLETYKSTTVPGLEKKVKTRTVIMVIFLVLAIAGIGLAAFFFLKWRDMVDQIAFEEAEKNRRARSAGRPAQGERRPEGSRPVRPQGDGARRPQGQAGRPEGRPERRPEGARPQGSPRPRPTEDRNGAPAERRRPEGARPEGRRPEGRPEPERRVEREDAEAPVRESAPQERPKAPVNQGAQPQAKPQRPKSRNFSDDDDEFEFGFLGWDDDDDN